MDDIVTDTRRLMAMIAMFVFTLVACVGAGPSNAVPTATTGSSASDIPSTAPTVDTTALPSSCFPPPHEAPEIEAKLPTMVAGRTLAIESYHGARVVTCVNGGTDADVADFATALAAEGLTLDDLSVAVAGRSDVAKDPPYLILAYSLTGHPGSEWPPTTGIDHPERVAFKPAEIGGKDVLVGDAAAMDQSEHARGMPIVWDGPTVHYLVVTDDMAWAKEVLAALH